MSYQAGDWVEVTSWEGPQLGKVTSAVPRGVHGLEVFKAIESPGFVFQTARTLPSERESYMVRMHKPNLEGHVVIGWCGHEEMRRSFQRGVP
jgi:hypothetical protein